MAGNGRRTAAAASEAMTMSFCLSDRRFDLIPQDDWLVMPREALRKLSERSRACGRLRLDGAIYVILSDELPSADPLAQLTDRELEVARRIAQGVTCKDIARQLSISRFTVAEHERRIRLKLKARSRACIAAAISTLL